MQRSDRAIVATFSDRERASAAFSLLRTDGFDDVWMAITQPAEPADSDAKPETPLDEPVRHDVAESSDGVLGAIGRFFSGEGNSLRRSLEDHGVDPLDAVAIDARLEPTGAVVTVFADERAELALAILRDGGGVIGPSRGEGVPPANLAVREPSAPPAVIRSAPLAAREEVFYERRPVASAARDEERKGLDDLM